MVSTFTPNIQLEEPARGDDVGTWDTPVNGNSTLLDLVVGGIATIGLNNSPIVLSAAQFKSRQITFNSTLTGTCAITFPTSFTKSYEIQNLCTGSSAFVITLGTTAAGGQQISCPPGETIDCFNDGTNIKFKNLGRVGGYWDYAGSSVPNWVSGCTVPPYLNCDGTTFSSATYPTLTVKLGGTTLPDSRGRFRAALNQTTGRITSAISGVDGNTLLAAGSSQAVAIAQANLPNVAFAVTAQSAVSVPQLSAAFTSAVGGGSVFALPTANTSLAILTVTGNAQSGGSGTELSIVPPTFIHGITMIRAA